MRELGYFMKEAALTIAAYALTAGIIGFIGAGVLEDAQKSDFDSGTHRVPDSDPSPFDRLEIGLALAGLMTARAPAIFTKAYTEYQRDTPGSV